ncbi:MAG: type II secretion system protein GspH [Gammaproteobacteria bacterium]|nr:MAG: type II secretion system protein GspH [Gammaproteobacteria bacterium]
MKANRQRGFTLLELVVVMAISALVMGAVTLSLSASVSKAEVRASGRRMAAALRYTRSQAIVTRREQVFEVMIDDDGSSYRVPGKDRIYELPEDVGVSLTTARMELTGDDAGGIRFYPDGSSTGGSITLGNDEFTQTLDIVWLTGEVVFREGEEEL